MRARQVMDGRSAEDEKRNHERREGRRASGDHVAEQDGSESGDNQGGEQHQRFQSGQAVQ